MVATASRGETCLLQLARANLVQRDDASRPRERLASDARSLSGRTILISGGSQGVGLVIAVRAARDGANVVFAELPGPDRTLPSTLDQAAKAVRHAGGQALAIVCDLRDEAAIEEGVGAAADTFGGIDICVNCGPVVDLSRLARCPPTDMT